MEVILKQEDLEKLIKNTYNGIEDINFGTENEIKVTLVVNAEKFLISKPASIPAEIAPPVVEIDPKTIEEKNKIALKKGLMAQGGKERVLTGTRF